MTRVATKSKSSPWSEFRTRDPNARLPFLDVGRAEVMFNSIVFPELGTTKALQEFIHAAYVASEGNSAALDLLIQAFDQWGEVDEAFEAKIRRSWRRSGMAHQDAVATLRRICEGQRNPEMAATMVEAIFDDPTFSFIAYLAWHNSED